MNKYKIIYNIKGIIELNLKDGLTKEEFEENKKELIQEEKELLTKELNKCLKEDNNSEGSMSYKITRLKIEMGENNG